MNEPGSNVDVVRDYLDALLQTPPQRETTPGEDPAASAWVLCTLGRLQLLLPSDAVAATVACADIGKPPSEWHMTRLNLGGADRRVIELARCIAPGMSVPPVVSLLPVTDSDWVLAVPGQPQPLSLPGDSIQWRPCRSSRTWLAGMSRDARYMALDVHALTAEVAGNSAPVVEEPPP